MMLCKHCIVILRCNTHDDLVFFVLKLHMRQQNRLKNKKSPNNLRVNKLISAMKLQKVNFEKGQRHEAILFTAWFTASHVDRIKKTLEHEQHDHTNQATRGCLAGVRPPG